MNQKSEAARFQRESFRRKYKKRCPVCGAEFEGTARRVYDKPACQKKVYYEGLRERVMRLKLSFALPVGGDPHRGAGVPEEEGEGLGRQTANELQTNGLQ